MAEETADPRRRAPWGIFLSVAVSGVAGYLLLLGLTLAIPSIPQVLNAKDAAGTPVPAAIAILQLSLGNTAGSALAALASVAMWFCGLSTITAASRTLFALARDHGTPFSTLLRSVNPTHGTPGPAIWAVTLAAMIGMSSARALPVVTSLGTVAFYLACLIPIALSLRPQHREWRSEALWTLCRFGPAINAIAIAYTICLCIILVMPPNQLAGQTLAGLIVLLTLHYFTEARRKYKGPEWTRKSSR